MQHFDVVIVGGGPAGSTLAALLAARTRLRTALFEAATFPRDHIGESFAHRVLPILAQSGALPKVLASDCWHKKYGGYYAWGGEAPSVALFDASAHARDGVYRWAIHVDRSRFDSILLDHATSQGAEVHQGAEVTDLQKVDGRWLVSIRGRDPVTCNYVVEASGRRTGRVGAGKREYLSDYKNVAIWTHVLGGLPAQSIDADWNLFHAGDQSAIGSFAFEDGWFWYIPVPKVIDGKPLLTHSIGLVTSPEVLEKRRDSYLNCERLLEVARNIPLLGELIRDARPVRNSLKTATNYSMIRSQFCDFDEGWIAIGDSAYFVDPLFSSGVAFATNQAATASLLLSAAASGEHDTSLLRDLWKDHDDSWHRIARGFALMIDQWYHGIAANNPDSPHWKARASFTDSAVRESTLHALVDAEVSPDLIEVITGGSGEVADGPLKRFDERRRELPSDDAVLKFVGEFEEGLSLGLELQRRVPPPHFARAITAWWDDPIANQDRMPPMFERPVPCQRCGPVTLFAPDLETLSTMGAKGSVKEWRKAFAGTDVFARLWEAGLLQVIAS